jgi:hypothetical protein
MATNRESPNWLKLLGNALFLPASLTGAGVESLFANEFGGDTNRRRDYIENLRNERPDDAFLQSLTDDELLGLLEPYAEDRSFWDIFTGTNKDVTGGEGFLQDLERARNAAANKPEDLNREQIFGQAAGDISADDARARQFAQEDIANLQGTYNTAKQDILGNQAEQNKAILGQVGSEMDKSRQNALEAGASAGLRLANNVNVLLSAQNKQRSTSLDTANNLSQMLLNQQNQAMGIRRGVNEREANKAQRTTGYQQQQYNQQRDIYNQELSDWNRRYEDQTRNVDPGLRDAYSGFNQGNR